jgi:hypothetical protein
MQTRLHSPRTFYRFHGFLALDIKLAAFGCLQAMRQLFDRTNLADFWIGRRNLFESDKRRPKTEMRLTQTDSERA